MIRLLKPAALILLLTSLSGCGYVGYRQSSDFKPQAVKQQNLVVLPTDLKVQEADMGGKLTPMPEKEALYRARLEREILLALQKKGYRATRADLSVLVTDEQKYAYGQLFTQAEKKFQEVYKKGSMKKEEAEKVNESVEASYANMVAALTRGDVFLITKFEAQYKSDGAYARDVAAGVLMTTAMALLTGSVNVQQASKMKAAGYVMLVNGTDGKIYWMGPVGYTEAADENSVLESFSHWLYLLPDGKPKKDD